MPGIIKSIYIADSSASDMYEVENAQLENNKGIVGDRYHKRIGKWSEKKYNPDYNLTLIEMENITQFHIQGINLKPGEFRRNIITQSIKLNELADKTFLLGNILCQGIRLCEPCHYLEEITDTKLVKTMLRKGGLRAQILANGKIFCGDRIIPLNL